MNEFDKEYWDKRNGIEQKHYHETLLWIDEFNPKNVLDYGCGRGERIHAFRYYGIPSYGFDISEYAIENACGLAKGFTSTDLPERTYDLVICYDVLEHLTPKEITDTLEKIRKYASNIVLFSICMEGDPNFNKDPTHKTKRSRSWWEWQIEKAGFKIEKIPNSFWFKDQLVLAKCQE